MKMIPMKRLVTTAVAAITIFLCSHSQSALAAANMTPNYEIKFLLNSAQVLDENHALQAAYRNLFSIEKDPTTIGVLYLDTPNRDFNQEGWTIDTNNNVSYITELSCKADTYEAATAERARLTDLCDSLGILLHEDSLKTQRILDSYLN